MGTRRQVRSCSPPELPRPAGRAEGSHACLTRHLQPCMVDRITLLPDQQPEGLTCLAELNQNVACRAVEGGQGSHVWASHKEGLGHHPDKPACLLPSSLCSCLPVTKASPAGQDQPACLSVLKSLQGSDA